MKQANRIGMWMIIMLVLATSVFAIGVTPIRKAVNFEPNGEETLSVTVLNDAAKDFSVMVYAEGSLSKYIEFDENFFTISNTESSKGVGYTLRMPSEMSSGVHKANIVVSEYPGDYEKGKAVASAVASAVSEVWVKVPYPGKYAESKLYLDTDENYVKFAIAMTNFGKEDIMEAHAKITITDPDNNTLDVIETGTSSIERGKQGKLTVNWPIKVKPGSYHASVELEYDGEIEMFERDFTIGNLFIDIVTIGVSDFSLGDIAAFDIILESEWNEVINDVYGELTVYGSDNKEISRFKTASIDIPAMSQATVKGYWDTKDVVVGTYNLRILIHYGEKVTEKLIETEVGIDSIRTELGPTAQVVADEGSGINWISAIVILLVVSNIAWFVYMRRKKKK